MKIQIPWYRRTPSPMSYDEVSISPIPSSNRIPKLNRPQTAPRNLQPVRQPATQAALQPTAHPSTVPVGSPSTIPDIGTNPFRTPGLAPMPIPFPIPGRIPNDTNQVPVPSYWDPSGNLNPSQVDFITKLKLVSLLSNVAAKEIYTFLSEYEYDKMKLADFNRDAEAEFGAFAATALSVLIVGKHLVNSFGKRLGFLVSPPILNDDLVKQYFNDENST